MALTHESVFEQYPIFKLNKKLSNIEHTVGGQLNQKVHILGQKRKNAMQKTDSLGGEIKMLVLGREMKNVPKKGKNDPTLAIHISKDDDVRIKKT